MQVIATAGHVDHGKSTLVRALTGMEPDRWSEERRRGMTIDLGYAWTTLPDGTQIVLVDVPGHQKFIGNMLAGVGPVPAVLLAVAADEGWGRQTTEHLAALDALGVRHGVLAVTRSDLGDADLAIEEAREYLAGTSLEGIEAVAVSPVLGRGLDELRAALVRMTSGIDVPAPLPTRLWIDRVFTIRGSGTVVTGTLTGGAIAAGDELRLAPTGELVRVRGLESLKVALDSVSAVARVAVNLRAVKPDEVHRGHALVAPGAWADVATVDVRLVNADPRLPAQLVLHVGSAAVAARVRPLGDAAARLTLAMPVPVRVGDRMLLRDPGRQHVAAGAVVLDINPLPLRRRGAAAVRGAELAAMGSGPDPGAEVHRRGAVRRSELEIAGILPPEAAAPARVVVVDDWLIAAEQWELWQRALEAGVNDWAREHPLQPTMSKAAAVRAAGLPDPTLLAALLPAVASLSSGPDGIAPVGVGVSFSPSVERAIEAVLSRLEASPFAAPEVPEWDAAGITERHLAALTRQGRLLRLAAGVYLRPDAIEAAIPVLAELPSPFTTSQARQALNTSRRTALPLLELLDRRGLTVRIDDTRRRMPRG